MWSQWARAVLVLAVVPMMSAQERQADGAETDRQRLSVTFEAGRLSVRIQDLPIGAAMEELTRRTGVKIAIAQEIEDMNISAALSGVALEAGLRALVGKYDSFFYYGANDDETPALRAVWVFSKGAALTIQPVALEACAGGKELELLLADQEPRVRKQAYDALIRRPDSRSRELVIQAIRGVAEKDDDLRQHILAGALSKGFDIPPEVLSELARADNSEQVRWIALDALSHDGAARQAAEAALTDASPAVRQKAEEILLALTSDEDRRQGNGRPPEQQP